MPGTSPGKAEKGIDDMQPWRLELAMIRMNNLPDPGAFAPATAAS
jgi:hypothetical protein